MLLDIPKAALFDLPKELVTDAKAAIENLNHPELFAEPNPPGVGPSPLHPLPPEILGMSLQETGRVLTVRYG